MYSFNWLVIIWNGGRVRLKSNVQNQGDRRIFEGDGEGGWEVLKIGQFSWTSYVYYPKLESKNTPKPNENADLEQTCKKIGTH